MARAVWIEAALNGPWGRARQPAIPVTVAEIVAAGIAAARSGAAILHLHAYDAATGRQHDDWEIYARIIEGIRGAVDAIVYPTIRLAGSGWGDEPGSAAARFAHIEELARRGLIEWTVCDPGSVNFALLEATARGATGFVYLNPEEHVREGLRIAARYGIRPSYAIYEPGFARLGAALAATDPAVPVPVYRLMFSDAFAWGFPPRAWALDAYRALLAEVAPRAPWMIAGLGVDITPLIEATVRGCGHVRVGLEDAPFGTATDNAALVEDAVRRIRAAGGEPATPASVRAALVAPG